MRCLAPLTRINKAANNTDISALLHRPFHAGIDEVGRGPLAGPVIVAAVCFTDDILPDWCADIRDSKKLSAEKRTRLAEKITAYAPHAYAAADIVTIDGLNILHATMKAMHDVAHRISAQMPAEQNIMHFWVDGNRLPDNMPQNASAIIKGDQSHLAIAAASILAKTLRDRLMQRLALRYPAYDWQNNMGYGTKKHLSGLAEHGISPHHRSSFSPIKQMLAQ